MLLENSAGAEIQGVSLIEKNTWVGDVTLQAGGFLIVTSGAAVDEDVRLFRTTDVGAGATTGTVATLCRGVGVAVRPLGIGRLFVGIFAGGGRHVAFPSQHEWDAILRIGSAAELPNSGPSCPGHSGQSSANAGSHTGSSGAQPPRRGCCFITVAGSPMKLVMSRRYRVTAIASWPNPDPHPEPPPGGGEQGPAQPGGGQESDSHAAQFPGTPVVDPRQVPGAAHAVHPAPGPRVDRYRPFVVPRAEFVTVRTSWAHVGRALGR
jgi:hypothetical protein